MLYNYINEKAQFVNDTAITEKKELSYTEKKALFGYLFDIFNNNCELFSDIGIESVSVLYDNCMIQNNELRFFCGEGIDIGNGIKFDSIYLNKNDCLIMCCYDENDQELLYI